jgi:hypothetical protein
VRTATLEVWRLPGGKQTFHVLLSWDKGLCWAHCLETDRYALGSTPEAALGHLYHHLADPLAADWRHPQLRHALPWSWRWWRCWDALGGWLMHRSQAQRGEAGPGA